MSTHYDRVPTLEERVRASRLIVTGRVQSIKPLLRTRIGEVEEEQAIAHLAIDKVLRGAVAGRELEVRFVYSRGNETRPESHPFADDQRLVLLLVPDVGRDIRPNTYVAYLRGVFPLTANDAFTIQTQSETSGGVARKTRVTLNALGDVIKRITADETAQRRDWKRLEPQLARRPVLPSITELPDKEAGAGPTPMGPTAAVAPRPRRKK